MTYRSDAATHLRPSRAARLRRRAAAAVVATALLVPAAPAHADPAVDALWQQCVLNGTVSPNQPMSVYQAALSNVPGDVGEYSPCVDLIKAAELASTRSTTAHRAPGGHTGQGAAPAGPMIPQGKTVAAPALATALEKAGVNAAAPAGQAPSAPSPGDQEASIGPRTPPIDLAAARAPSVAGVLNLPVPLLAAAVAVLLMSLLPAARKLAGRFGARRGA